MFIKNLKLVSILNSCLSSLIHFLILSIFLSSAIVCPISVLANSGGGEAKKEEEKKEEGGEKKEEGKEGEKKESEGRPAWMTIEAKIQELAAKIKSKNENIEKMIEEKNHFPEHSSELKSLIKEIVKEHVDMEKLAQEYDKQVNILKYRFPERNAKKDRKYEKIPVKSVEEIEKAVGIDAKLMKAMRRARSQYRKDKNESPDKASETPLSPALDGVKEKSIEEQGPILLHK